MSISNEWKSVNSDRSKRSRRRSLPKKNSPARAPARSCRRRSGRRTGRCRSASRVVQARLEERDRLDDGVDRGFLADDPLAEPVADLGRRLALGARDHEQRQAAVDRENLLDEERRDLRLLADGELLVAIVAHFLQQFGAGPGPGWRRKVWHNWNSRSRASCSTRGRALLASRATSSRRRRRTTARCGRSRTARRTCKAMHLLNCSAVASLISRRRPSVSRVRIASSRFFLGLRGGADGRQVPDVDDIEVTFGILGLGHQPGELGLPFAEIAGAQQDLRGRQPAQPGTDTLPRSAARPRPALRSCRRRPGPT